MRNVFWRKFQSWALGVWVLKTKGIEKMMQAPKAQGGIEAFHCPWAFVHLLLMCLCWAVLRFLSPWVSRCVLPSDWSLWAGFFACFAVRRLWPPALPRPSMLQDSRHVLRGSGKEMQGCVQTTLGHHLTHDSLAAIPDSTTSFAGGGRTYTHIQLCCDWAVRLVFASPSCCRSSSAFVQGLPNGARFLARVPVNDFASKRRFFSC